MRSPTTAAPPRTEPTGALGVYRDDGPIARAIGRAVARVAHDSSRPTGLAAAHDSSRPIGLAAALDSSRPATGAAEVALVVAAAVPLLALVAFGGDDVSDLVAGAAIAWAVVCAGASTSVVPGSRLRWALLPVLRLTEYAGLLWLAALAGPSSYPAVFALLAAVAFRHYDLVYRMRLRGIAPAPWVNAVSLGWDGRLIGGYLLLVAGALPAGFFAAAAVLGLVFVAEAVVGWVAFGRRAQRPAEYEDGDEEDEE
jgi:Family of unknown function (DUF5941)